MPSIALIQMRVIGGDPEANLDRAGARLAEAAEAGAQLAVLPEALDLGWTHGSATSGADTIPGGRACRALCEAAGRHGIWVCAGLTERARTGVFNAAVLITPDGEIALHHRKIYELGIAHHLYALGDRLQVVPTPFGTVGMMICADAFAPGQVISRTLALMGAQLILSPCAWAVPADHDNQTEPYGQLWLDNYGPVARDFHLWIAGVSNVGRVDGGPWRGRKCIGCSMLIGPDGRPTVRGPYGEDAETILHASVELQPPPARGDGWPDLWDKDRDSRGSA